jgi:hypothetical protein
MLFSYGKELTLIHCKIAVAQLPVDNQEERWHKQDATPAHYDSYTPTP